MAHFKINTIISLTYIISATTSCGLINTSSTGYFNDAVPSNSTVVATGSFVGANGNTVTGQVIVYSTAANTYVIRLQNLAMTYQPNLQVIGTGSPSANFQATLRGNSGNQNYSPPSYATPISWTQVKIQNPAAVSGYGDVAVALLTIPPASTP